MTRKTVYCTREDITLTRERPMLVKRLLLYLGIVTLSTPALCAQFYIVQDPRTNRCTISEQPPTTGDDRVVVGDGAYGDRASAEADMRTIAACTGS